MARSDDFPPEKAKNTVAPYDSVRVTQHALNELRAELPSIGLVHNPLLVLGRVVGSTLVVNHVIGVEAVLNDVLSSFPKKRRQKSRRVGLVESLCIAEDVIHLGWWIHSPKKAGGSETEDINTICQRRHLENRTFILRDASLFIRSTNNHERNTLILEAYLIDFYGAIIPVNIE